MAVFASGLDVSQFQGSIDWAAVAASGRSFALVRLGTTGGGLAYPDENFRTNVAGAQAAGLDVGAYYYTSAATQQGVIDELVTLLPLLEGLVLQYPVFVDVEAQSLTGLDKNTLTGLVRFAMDILYQRGWYGGYYTYTYFAQTYLDTSQLSAYPFWVADYRGYVGYTGSYELWQYSSGGQVPGVTGPVDLDVSYKDYPAIIKAAGFNGYPPVDPCRGREALTPETPAASPGGA